MEQLPPLEQLSRSSGNICVVVKNGGKDKYLSVPIHYYYAWLQLQDNNSDENLKEIISTLNRGTLFVRLPTLEELDNYKFTHYESIENIFVSPDYYVKINSMLKGTIYEFETLPFS